MKLRAEIIAIGTEILLGDIVNSNASYIARGLAALGIDTFHQQVVGDNPARVRKAFEEAYQTADLVITSGGLGPTDDDLSKEMGAEYFGVPMYMDETAKEHIQSYMTLRGRTIPHNNWKQAMLPVGSKPLYNHNGTAPGFILEKEGKILIMLPGPPSEIIPMFDEQVIPYLKSLSEDVMISRTLHICGMGESAVAEVLHDDMVRMTNPTLAPYAKEGVVDLRITAKASSEEECRRMIAPVEEHIRSIFGQMVFGVDKDTLPQVLIDMLVRKGLHLAVAEACLGGLISDRIVSISGASRAYLGGIVAYSDESKVSLLGVKEETLKQFGAVSEETAREMAIGAARAFGAEAALAETGIAEAASDTHKTAGTVCLGIYLQGQVSSVTLKYSRNRNSNRDMAATAAINEMRKALLGAE